jgi:hypothetical protein
VRERFESANTQGDTLEKARTDLEGAVMMVIDSNREMSEQLLPGTGVIGKSLILPRRSKRIDLIRHLNSRRESYRRGRHPKPSI